MARFTLPVCRLTPLFCWLCLLATPVFASSGAASATPPAAAAKVSLTTTEQVFLQAHPLIRLGVNEDWTPYVIRRPSGELEGFEVDLLQYLNAETGANLQLVAGRWKETVEQADRREIDGLTMTVASPARAASFLFSDSYISVYPAFVVGADNLRSIHSIGDLRGETVAILAGNQFYRNLLATYPEITVLEMPVETGVISAVLERKAVAGIVSTAAFNEHYKSFANSIRIAYVATDHPLNLLYSIRKDWPELVSIINKGLAALPAETFNKTYSHWFGMAPPVVEKAPGVPAFTEAEQAWLAQRHVVRARVGNVMPFHADQNGPQGMSVDYLNKVAEKAGFKVDYVTGVPWEQGLTEIREHRNIDLLLSAARSPEREAFLFFTNDYLHAPLVIFTREDSPFVSSINDLTGQEVLVERGYVTQKRMENEYPGVRLLIKESTEAALRALAAGEGDAYIGDLTSGAYFLRKAGLDNVKVVAPSPFGTHDQAMAVRNDWPELVGIINKTMATFSGEEHAAIRNRWLPPVRYEYGLSQRDVLESIGVVSSILLAVIMVILIWNKKLVREVTARTAAEAALSESAVVLNKAQEIGKLGSWSLDMSGHCIWSDQMYRVFGVSRETFVPDKEAFFTLVHPDDRQAMQGWIDDCAAGNKSGELLFRVVWPDGSVHSISGRGSLLHDANDKPSIMSGTCQDITERKAVEDELRKALNFTEILLDQSPMGIRVFDGETGVCRMINPAAAAISGGPVEILVKQNFRELNSWRKAGLATVAETVLADGVPRQVEAEMTTSFGKILSARYFFARFFVEDRPHLLTIGQDISEEKRLTEEKWQIEEKMLHVQKLESLGVLAGGIAHDFNNILMAVIANADLALMRLAPESPAVNYLQQIQVASSRAADLAGQMLAYSGKGKFVVEKMDINRVIEEMMHMLEVSISKKAQMRFNLGKDLPAVEADATQFRQVIMNLVINASEALGENNGVIAIATGLLNCDRDYLREFWLSDDLGEGLYVYIEISDNGCGMDKETLDCLYDPFFSTKFTGRGLGMAAVLGIVRGHKGGISVDSEAGKGTTFKVLLPSTSSQAEPLDKDESESIWHGGGQVLLVDDEDMILVVGEAMLEELGYKVLTASNGLEGLALFREHRDTIDLVVMDLTMPQMGGEDAFREMRKLNPEVKVIITSGYNEQEINPLFAGKGLAGFIQKPFRISTLRETLTAVVGVGGE